MLNLSQMMKLTLLLWLTISFGFMSIQQIPHSLPEERKHNTGMNILIGKIHQDLNHQNHQNQNSPGGYYLNLKGGDCVECSL